MRHGARLDMNADELKEAGGLKYEMDTPLSKLGLNQAKITGKFVNQIIGERSFKVWSSPYLRCLQTAD